MIANYSLFRKSYIWTNKVFFHFIEEAVFNAFLLLKKTGSMKRFMDTKLDLLKAIIAETDAKIDEIVPEFIPATDKKDKHQNKYVVCTHASIDNIF